MKFSNIQTYQLMVGYPYPYDDNDDIRQYKGLYAIWDTSSSSSSSSPIHVLEASGQPTAVSFSDTQLYVVSSLS